MPHGETVSGLYEFFEGDRYATVQLHNTGDGWLSEWWVSRNISRTYELQVLGYVRLPIFGETKEQAYRRLDFIYEELMNFMAFASGGVGDTGAGGDVASARLHCKAHLQAWGDTLSSISKTEHTSALYSLAVEFGVNNPAALIAEVEVVGVRTVHDRIAHARRIGLLDSYGKGRIKPVGGSVVDEEDAGVAEEMSEDRRAEVLRRILKHNSNVNGGISAEDLEELF